MLGSTHAGVAGENNCGAGRQKQICNVSIDNMLRRKKCPNQLSLIWAIGQIQASSRTRPTPDKFALIIAIDV